MKTEVTRTVVTLVEVHTRETGDATVKGVSKVSDDSTLSRKVWINGEEVYAEQYPTRCIDKFAQPELQAFLQMLGVSIKYHAKGACTYLRASIRHYV